MKKGISALLVLFSLSLFLPVTSLAAKVRLSRGGTSTASTGSTAASTGSRSVPTSVKFRADRKAILINFGDFSNAISVSYTLTYTNNGMAEGARGTATPETAGQQRELLFGTCSSGVCRYHTNVTNAKLVVDSKLKSGLTVRKTFRLKV
jgi:hypothetical protein